MNTLPAEVTKPIETQLAELNIREYFPDIPAAFFTPDDIAEGVMELLSFCGCGSPDDALYFFYKQFESIADETNINYTSSLGAKDFFVLNLYLKGLVCNQGKVTPQGRLILSLLKEWADANALTEELTSYQESEEDRRKVLATSANPRHLGQWKYLVEKRTPWEKVIDNPFNESSYGFSITLALYFLNTALGILFNAHYLTPQDESVSSYEVRYGKIEKEWLKETGFYYWTWYMLDFFGFEEHGGSSPGWIDSTRLEDTLAVFKFFGEVPIPQYIETPFSSPVKMGKTYTSEEYLAFFRGYIPYLQYRQGVLNSNGEQTFGTIFPEPLLLTSEQNT